jgi:hypothetical protein
MNNSDTQRAKGQAAVYIGILVETHGRTNQKYMKRKIYACKIKHGRSRNGGRVLSQEKRKGL